MVSLDRPLFVCVEAPAFFGAILLVVLTIVENVVAGKYGIYLVLSFDMIYVKRHVLGNASSQFVVNSY